MKKLLFAFMAMTLFACSGDDSAPVDPNNGSPNPENPNPENPNPVEECDNILFGSAELTTQAAVDAFASHNYCQITGSLSIGDFGVGSDITDLSGLAGLKEIGGQLFIADTPMLVNLNGLQSLEKVGELVLYHTGIATLEHLESLSQIGSFDEAIGRCIFHLNYQLVNLKGLEKIQGINTLGISGNNGLVSFDGLQGLQKVKNFEITSTDIINMTGLEGLQEVDVLYVVNNQNLESLAGLSSLTKVRRLTLASNDKLMAVNQVSNLTNLSELFVHMNAEFTAFPALNGAVTEMEILDVTGNLALDGFSGLTKIMNVRLSGVTSLHGLENVTTLSGLEIFYSPGLTSIAPLSNVTSVVDHPEEFTDEYEGIWVSGIGITSLEGLQNIDSFNGKLKFRGNLQLSNFCAISNIVNAAESTDIQNNAYNPSKEDILAGNCSQ